MKLRQTFRTAQTLDNYQDLNGQLFTIVAPVDPSQYDADETGPMFVVSVAGQTIDAFEDELFDLEGGEEYISGGF